MVSKASKKILKIVERWKKYASQDWIKSTDYDQDPLRALQVLPDMTRKAILEDVPEDEKMYYDFSTRVVGFQNVPSDGTVMLLFDELAWEFLSYESDFHAYRNKLEEMLKKPDST